MAVNIRNPEAEELAEALARLAGETKAEAVTRALRDRLARPGSSTSYSAGVGGVLKGPVPPVEAYGRVPGAL